AQQEQKPVVLTCTSGTALLNYAPAIAEAWYQQLPLIVISADRPKEWIDHGEGQSIRQVGALKNLVKSTFNLPQEPKTEIELSIFSTQVVEGLQLANSFPKGPIHFNLPLEEPLYNTTKTSFS